MSSFVFVSELKYSWKTFWNLWSEESEFDEAWVKTVCSKSSISILFLCFEKVDEISFLKS
jgi:diacylglycerol kinase